MVKKYILPDGEEIDLSKIKSIDALKSVSSRTFVSFGYWYFTIYFIDETSKEIRKDYFYSDWGKVKNELQKIRDHILIDLI